jgi:internalin A
MMVYSDVAPDYVLEERPEGRALVATGPWTREAAAALEGADVDALELNYARGFFEPDLEFLEAWPVRQLMLLDRKQTDLSPISRLGGTLEELSVQAAPGAVISAGDFPALTGLSAYWDAVHETISEAKDLRRLTVMAYGGIDLSPLSSNESLIRVTLKEALALESLSGAEGLLELQKLAVGRAPFLHDLMALRQVEAPLRDLQFEDCMGIEALEEMGSLEELTWLGVSNCGPIESLKPLQSLSQLETLYAWGTTRISDNDLSPLTRLPKLNEVRMRERREYRPQVSEIQQILASRSG